MDGYFDWLCRLVGIGNGRTATYYDLARLLFDRNFYAKIKSDENRAWDGKGLRAEYSEGIDSVYRSLKGPCSILEMLVALAKRMDFTMQDDSEEDRTELFFWSMIDNLGLMIFDDEYFSGNKSLAEREIEKILDRWLEREYMADGRGGLFPLKNPRGDQCYIQIWYQMNQWLMENNDLSLDSEP